MHMLAIQDHTLTAKDIAEHDPDVLIMQTCPRYQTMLQKILESLQSTASSYGLISSAGCVDATTEISQACQNLHTHSVSILDKYTFLVETLGLKRSTVNSPLTPPAVRSHANIPISTYP